MTREEHIENLKAIASDMPSDKCSDWIESLMAVVKALEQVSSSEKPNKWIPCSERLPEPNRLVLCYITTGVTETYYLAFWNDIQNAWEEGIGGCRLLEHDLGYKVVAWMPLPEPYKPEGGRMKKGITFYINDDVDMIAFCGTLCTQVKDTDEPIRGVTMLNFSLEDIKQCSEWYIPVKGKAEPYQSEIPTGAEGSDKE